MELIGSPSIFISGRHLAGEKIDKISRTLAELGAVFYDKAAYAAHDRDEVIYEVESYFAVPQNTTGGLFYGITFIKPGTIGNEYYMTKGHFHTIRDRAEVYITMEGEGMLILMDEQRNTRAELMVPGSIHYIPANTAHRTANTGTREFSFGAVWPADAGHDYDTIHQHGFSKILVNLNGTPALVDRQNAMEQH
jgi:glucose-6-phosphate isomerase